MKTSLSKPRKTWKSQQHSNEKLGCSMYSILYKNPPICACKEGACEVGETSMHSLSGATNIEVMLELTSLHRMVETAAREELLKTGTAKEFTLDTGALPGVHRVHK